MTKAGLNSMRLLAAILLSASFTVQAEWVFIVESVEGDKTYIETKYQAEEFDSVTVWQKTNEASGESIRIRVAYNCKNFTAQVISEQTFSAHDFEGDDITNPATAMLVGMRLAEGLTSPVPPETVGSAILDYVCE